MEWRLARSLDVLRREINTRWPNRSTKSDGTIGDKAHRKRDSDHNPNAAGVVTAFDITHDPENGVDCNWLAEYIANMGRAGDPRVKYVIWNRRISNPSIDGGRWRPYEKSNPHTLHAHVSVSSVRKHYDSIDPWLPPVRAQEVYDVVTPDSQRAAIREFQEDVNFINTGRRKYTPSLPHSTATDGIWGSDTQKKWRRAAGLLNIWLPSSDRDPQAQKYEDWMARTVLRKELGVA